MAITLETKQKEERNMKTTINVRKTTLKITTVLVSIILICLTVSAQDLWEGLISNDHIKTISLALTENPKEKEKTTSDKNISSTNYFVTFEESIEESLELETWMISETFFPSIMIFEEEEEEEEEEMKDSIELENLIKTDAEQKLEFEKWMTDGNIWKI
jgi:hypothetical protein